MSYNPSQLGNGELLFLRKLPRQKETEQFQDKNKRLHCDVTGCDKSPCLLSPGAYSHPVVVVGITHSLREDGPPQTLISFTPMTHNPVHEDIYSPMESYFYDKRALTEAARSDSWIESEGSGRRGGKVSQIRVLHSFTLPCDHFQQYWGVLNPEAEPRGTAKTPMRLDKQPYLKLLERLKIEHHGSHTYVPSAQFMPSNASNNPEGCTPSLQTNEVMEIT